MHQHSLALAIQQHPTKAIPNIRAVQMHLHCTSADATHDTANPGGPVTLELLQEPPRRRRAVEGRRQEARP